MPYSADLLHYIHGMLIKRVKSCPEFLDGNLGFCVLLLVLLGGVFRDHLRRNDLLIANKQLLITTTSDATKFVLMYSRSQLNVEKSLVWYCCCVLQVLSMLI